MRKTLILAITAAAGLATAMPAYAQSHDAQRHDRNQSSANHNAGDRDSGRYNSGNQNAGDRGNWHLSQSQNTEIRQDVGALRQSIDRAAARRTISQREATGLRQRATEIQRLYANYARNGLTRTEVTALQSRVNSVRGALRMERRDWDGQRG